MTAHNVKVIFAGFVVFAVVFVVQQTAFAVPSPEVRERMRKAAQKAAPECLEIEVLSSKATPKRRPDYLESKIGTKITGIDVLVDAKVIRVRRSQSGLKKGNVITILYTEPVDTGEFPGPEYVGFVNDGGTYVAYLRKIAGAKAYTPAAGSGSFDFLE